MFVLVIFQILAGMGHLDWNSTTFLFAINASGREGKSFGVASLLMIVSCQF